MRFLNNLTLSALGAGGLVAGFILLPLGEELHASGGSFVAMADTDGDGLDDALEARLRTSPDAADTDGDSCSDLEELLLRSDPVIAEGTSLTPSNAIYADLYALGSSVYVQVFFLYRVSAGNVLGAWSAGDATTSLSPVQLRPYVVEFTMAPTSVEPWHIRAITLRIPRDAFDAAGSVSMAFQAVLDDSLAGGQLILMHVPSSQQDTSAGHLVQLRSMSLSIAATATGGSGLVATQRGEGGQKSGPKTGGLVPVEPDDGTPPGDGAPEQICYQVLRPVAHLGRGRTIYQVDQATCEPMATGVCFTGCSSTIGNQVTVMDLVGLIGGL